MRRLYLIIIYMCLTLVVGRVHAQYYSVNYDKQIVAAMAAAFMGHRTKRFFQWSGKMGERF